MTDELLRRDLESFAKAQGAGGNPADRGEGVEEAAACLGSAIGKGLADVAEGHTKDFRKVFARLERKYASTTKDGEA